MVLKLSNNLVSIIIPTYNRAHLIGETLDSILAQTYTNWECIIVDDGSADNTATLVAEYIIKDNRFQYHTRPVDRLKGANACRNYGFELSSGEFIKWFDSDDIMHPDFLEKQVEILETNKEFDFCVCQSLTFYENSNKVDFNRANRNPKGSLILNYLVKNHYFLTAAPLWRTFFLTGKHLFDEELSDSHESDFHFRMLMFFPKYVYKENFLYSVRRGNESITQNSQNKKASLESRIIFFNKSRKLILSQNVEEKNVIIKYLTFRISQSIYELCVFNSRFGILNQYKKVILDIILQKNLFFLIRLKLFFGFVLLLLFGKGYSFLNRKFEIREVITN